MTPAQTPEIEGLLFGAYGTLFDLDSLVPHCNAVFPARGQDICRLWRAKQTEYTHLLSMMGRFEDFWQVTHKALVVACQALKLTCAPEQRDRLMENVFHLNTFADVRPTLEVLARRYPLAILSNGSPKMLKMVVEHNGLQKFFPQIISTGEVRSYKPHLQVYQWATQKLGREPNRLGLVSAHTWDITGAKAFGLWTGWLNRTAAPWDDLGFEPDATVASLAKLPPILGLTP